MMTGLLYTAVQSPCVMIPCLASVTHPFSVINACQHVTLLLLPVLLTVSHSLPAQTTFLATLALQHKDFDCYMDKMLDYTHVNPGLDKQT